MPPFFPPDPAMGVLCDYGHYVENFLRFRPVYCKTRMVKFKVAFEMNEQVGRFDNACKANSSPIPVMISYPGNSPVRAVTGQLVPGSWFRVIIVLCLFTFGIVRCTAADAVKAAPIPPFSAKFTLQSEIPAADPATPPEIIMRSEGYFAYSNGVWEVEAVAVNPQSQDRMLLNARRIAGGTRRFFKPLFDPDSRERNLLRLLPVTDRIRNYLLPPMYGANSKVKL